jgi:hypothetical protein
MIRNPILFLLALTLLLTSPQMGSAQSPLDDVETLLGRGRVFQAREHLQAWLDGEGASAGRMDRQRGIWLRGLLTVDPSMADMDFRRLVLEFPGGPYSDDALLRLAQSADLRGDLRRAHSHYSALARDYPSSPNRGRAAGWLRDHRDEVEALGAELTPGIETTPSPILGGTEIRVPSEGGDSLSVQLGAFRNFEGASSLASALRGLGYEPRLIRVPGSDLIRVRLGRFSRRDEATRLQQELVEAGFEAAVVKDAQAEEEVG